MKTVASHLQVVPFENDKYLTTFKNYRENNVCTQSAISNHKSGIFCSDIPNSVSHNTNLNVKKGDMFITVSRGLRWCHGCWLIRSHCLCSKRAYIIGLNCLPYATFESVAFRGKNFCFARIHWISRELAMFMNS